MLKILHNLHISKREPVSLIHFVTRRCNARCSFCFIDFENPQTFQGELTLAEIQRLTKSVGSNLLNVNLTGGEPFLRSDLVDIARCWLTNGNVRSLFVSTNGAFPNRIRQFLDILSKDFPDRRIIVSISIDDYPEKHDKIRKVGQLFDLAMESYRIARSYGNVAPNIGITVSHENYIDVESLYDHLVNDLDVQAISVTIVRNEGVFTVPSVYEREILDSYSRLTRRVQADLRSGRIKGYGKETLHGRLHNKKNMIMYSIIEDTYLDSKFISPCPAGALFGVIDANGDVYPCEILDERLGNLRDYDLDFMALWDDQKARRFKRWVVDSKCNCTYECAWSFNILSNWRYQPSLLAAALGKHW